LCAPAILLLKPPLPAARDAVRASSFDAGPLLCLVIDRRAAIHLVLAALRANRWALLFMLRLAI
jgi:hypothetical protein